MTPKPEKKNVPFPGTACGDDNMLTRKNKSETNHCWELNLALVTQKYSLKQLLLSTSLTPANVMLS